jgi:hypothetical protein
LTDVDSLTCAHVSHSTSEAQVIITMLKAYGISAVVQGGEFVGNYPQFALLNGGLPILVPQSALRNARQLIDEFKNAEP